MCMCTHVHVHVWQGKILKVEGKALRYQLWASPSNPGFPLGTYSENVFCCLLHLCAAIWPSNQSLCRQYVQQCESVVPRKEEEHLTHLTHILRAEILDISGLFCQRLPVPNTVMTCGQQEKQRLRFRNWASSPIIEASCFSVKETVLARGRLLYAQAMQVCVLYSVLGLCSCSTNPLTHRHRVDSKEQKLMLGFPYFHSIVLLFAS